MTASLLKDGFPSAHRTTRQRIESSIDLRRLFFAIDTDPGLIGAGVVYIDETFNVVTLREFQAVCSVVPKKLVLREAPRYVGPAEFKRMLEHEPRESRLVAQALGTAVTCAGAILSWIVVTSGVMLLPFTAGTSAVITFIGQAALAASVTQCIVGLGRTGAEAFAPQLLDQLDSEAWYQAVDATLNAIALLGVATSALTTIKTVNTATRVTGKPLRQVLKGLNRQERARLNDELLKLRDPRLTSKLLKVRQATGVLPKRISATEMQLATVNHIRDAMAATLGFASSSIPGKIKTLAIGVYEEASQ
ncbi:NAD synthetase [Pseudomonas sp. ADAK22]|uniref:NAD synthetase n=1 Tax=Pseudomonas sp. ADAK22 TaxID=2730851 RepID=UPI0014648434|nr:NAD synthetase [Pseudomonas sp. ADAK22]QJI12704.1 NAD synthetase [Pseudomonas sp. ADAK22]